MEYLILIILPLIGILIFDGRRVSRAGTACFWALALLSALFAGLRFRVGVDTVYDDLTLATVPAITDFSLSTFSSYRHSPATLLLAGLSRLICHDLWPMRLLLALWTAFSFFAFAYQRRSTLGNRLFLFAFLYLFQYYVPINFETMREAAAVAFFLRAWPALLQRRFLRYYLLVFFAILFHYAAVFTLILPLVTIPQIRKCLEAPKLRIRSLIIFFTGCIAGGYLLYFLVFELIPSLPIHNPWLTHTLANYPEYIATHSLNWRGTVGLLFKTCAYPLVAMLLLRRTSLAVVLGVGCMLLSIGFQPAERFFNYFAIICICLVVEAVAERRALLPAWGWALAFLPLIGMVAYGYTGRHAWYDGSQHYGYETYVPYISVFTERREMVREITSLQDFEMHGPECIPLLSPTLQRSDSLTREEVYWMEYLRENN